MRDPGDELADRGQLPRLNELLLRRLELVQVRVQLGVEAGVLDREGGVIGEGLREMDLVVGEAAPDVRDARSAPMTAPRTTRGTAHAARLLDSMIRASTSVGREMSGSARTSDVVTTSPLHDRPAGRPRAGRRARRRSEAWDDGPGGGDRDEDARRGIQPEEDRGAGPEQPHDALDRSLGHRGRIEGRGELAGQRGEGRDALGLAPRRLRLPERTDVAIDAPDEAEQPVLRVEQTAAASPIRMTVDAIAPTLTPAKCCRRTS